MKKLGIVLLLVAFATAAWAQAPAEKAPATPEAKAAPAQQCPCCKDMAKGMCKRMGMKGGCCCGDHQMAQTAKTTEVDPVCGMAVNLEKAVKYEYKGKTYYFCCDACMEAFKADPEKYLAKKEAPAPAKGK
ncbi:MAG: YHS domain-containing protein [Terriglobales bacterium]